MSSDYNFISNVVLEAAKDAILGLNEECNAALKLGKKVFNLGVGVYVNEFGKVPSFEAVKKVEKQLASNELDHNYLNQAGDAEFNQLSKKLIFGKIFDENKKFDEKILSVQSLSGSGGLRIAIETLCKLMIFKSTDDKLLINNEIKKKLFDVYVSDPTWAPHKKIVAQMFGMFDVKSYRYYDSKKKNVDFEGMKKDVEDAKDGSIFILHTSNHNPTGLDLNENQWKELGTIFIKKNHIAIFDTAYQGFGNSIEDDVKSIKIFTQDLNYTRVIVSQSYAKNFGLYGERIGCVHFVCGSEAEKKIIESHVKVIVRGLYSSPPMFGARIVKGVLSNEEYKKEWLDELEGIRSNIKKLRINFRKQLELKTNLNWEHITNQCGMFSYTGLTEEQVVELKKNYVFLTNDGRIAIPGLKNEKTIEEVASIISKVIIEVPFK